MKTRTLEMQCQEKEQTMRWKILTTVALFWALLGCPSESYAQSMHNVDDGKVVTEVTQPDSLSKKDLKKPDCIEVSVDDWVKIEPDPEWEDDWVKIEPDPEWDEPVTEWWEEKHIDGKESPVKFTVSSWVWYTIGWKAFRWNRVTGSWQLFKGQKWETDFFWFIDLDSPLKTKGCGKITLSKKLYKWIGLEWDYTFTWTGTNIARFGLWYRGQMWDGSYKIVAYPLNTNWSPISAKVQIWTKVWKNWRLDSFIFVDFDGHSYISETEYAHKLAKWIALFVQARFSGKFTKGDDQALMFGTKIDIK